MAAAIVAFTGAGDGGLNADRAVRTVVASPDVQGVQPLKEIGYAAGDLPGLGDQIHRSGSDIDDRCSGDADLRQDVGGADIIRARRGDASAGVDEASLPKRHGVAPRIAVGVESIDAVVFGNDKDHVVNALVGYGDVRNIERLRINVAVHGVREKLAEAVGVDVTGRQGGFVRVRPHARTVVVIRPDVHLGECHSQIEANNAKDGEENTHKGPAVC